MHIYKICFITYYWLPICIDRFCDHYQGTFSTKIFNTLRNCICGTNQRYSWCLRL